MGIVVYTDGGCSGNPGPGAWAYVISRDDNLIQKSGITANTTNNRMELTAVINALHEFLPPNRTNENGIDLYTDSMYVKRGITEWIGKWIKNGWKNSSGQPVKNKDLWIKLKSLADRLSVNWHWVRGHNMDRLNTLCDHLVKQELKLKG